MSSDIERRVYRAEESIGPSAGEPSFTKEGPYELRPERFIPNPGETTLIFRRHPDKANQEVVFTGMRKGKFDWEGLQGRVDEETGLFISEKRLYAEEFTSEFKRLMGDETARKQFINEEFKIIAPYVIKERTTIIDNLTTYNQQIQKNLIDGLVEVGKEDPNIKNLKPPVIQIRQAGITATDIEALREYNEILKGIVKNINEKKEPYETKLNEIVGINNAIIESLHNYTPGSEATLHESIRAHLQQGLVSKWEEYVKPKAEDHAYVSVLEAREAAPLIYPGGIAEVVKYHKSIVELLKTEEESKKANIISELEQSAKVLTGGHDDRLSQINNHGRLQAIEIGKGYVDIIRQLPINSFYMSAASNVQRAREAGKITDDIIGEQLIPLERRVDKLVFRKAQTDIRNRPTLTLAELSARSSVLDKIRIGIEYDGVAHTEIPEFTTEELDIFPMLKERSAVYWDDQNAVFNQNYQNGKGLVGTPDDLVRRPTPLPENDLTVAQIMLGKRAIFLWSFPSKFMGGFNDVNLEKYEELKTSIYGGDEKEICKAILENELIDRQPIQDIIGMNVSQIINNYNEHIRRLNEIRNTPGLKNRAAFVNNTGHSLELLAFVLSRANVVDQPGSPYYSPAGTKVFPKKQVEQIVHNTDFRLIEPMAITMPPQVVGVTTPEITYFRDQVYSPTNADARADQQFEEFLGNVFAPE